MPILLYYLQFRNTFYWVNISVDHLPRPSHKELDDLQKCQNKLLRALNGSKISEHISNKSMLIKFKMLSVNQMNAQIKLTEMWKSTHITNYPIKSELLVNLTEGTNTRSRNAGFLKEGKVTVKSQRTFTNDAIHIWNQAPSYIKECISFNSAKKQSKSCGLIAILNLNQNSIQFIIVPIWSGTCT